MPKKKTTRPSPAVPPWMKASWKSANRKPHEKLTMRDVDAIISEVRAENRPEAFQPVELKITLTKSKATWIQNLAAEQRCSIEELIMHAVWVYSNDHPNLEEDRVYFTEAVAPKAKRPKTGRAKK